MNRSRREPSRDLPASRPTFPFFTVIGVAGLVLLVGISWVRNRQADPAQPAIPKVESGDSQTAEGEPASRLLEQASPTTATQPLATDSHAQRTPTIVASASATSERLIGELMQLQINAGKLTSQQGLQIQQSFRQLVAQGAVALPGIREFMSKNEDLPFGDNGTKLAGATSLRTGLIDALRKIGGPDAAAISLQVLQNTADPLEISLLARNLEEAEPGQHRQEALDVARQTLAQAADGKLDLKDVGPLFQVLQTYGDSSLVTDLEKVAPKWGYYATIALAGLPSGEGIHALIKLAQDPAAPETVQGKFGLQMLAQVSSQYPDGAAALLAMARQNQVPDFLWTKVAEGLAGEQYQIGLPFSGATSNPAAISGLKTYHLESGNQNFYSLPLAASGSSSDVSQRLAVIDQLLTAASGNPAAVDALNQARAKLSGTGAPK